jgi:SpoVK/Ycf46/Vps4 family AAA+-type ATPase
VCALFSVPSRTGKTIAAGISADRLKLALDRIDLVAVVSKYIGETKKNLSRVFQDAQDGSAIFFFDEADALFGKRTGVKDSHDRYANIEINYPFQRTENDQGFATLATNIRSLVNQAFLCCLSFQVEFLSPDVLHRQRVWKGIV